jgi:hypothetical protein
MFELKDYLALRPKGSELQLAGVSPTPYGDAYQPVSVIR